MSSFFVQTGLKFLAPFINSIVLNALRLVIPSVNQVLSQIGRVPNWCLIHVILHHVPYSTVNWI